jgi:diacylglycerol kinase family enzyme
MYKVAVIFNSEKVDGSRLQSIVNGLLGQHNLLPALMLATTAQEPGALQARQALAQNCNLLMIAGGDGTLRSVLEAVAGQDISIAIIPRGTGNVLARNLGIPLGSISKAVRLAIEGADRSIDLGKVTMTFAHNGAQESHVFGVMAGIGLDAKIFMNTDAKLKKRIGWVAYIDGGLRSLPVRFETMDVSVNSRPSKQLKVHSLAIGNCGLLPGNINIMPAARLDDGLLDVAAVGPRRFWNWIDFWNRVTWVNWLVKKVRAWRKIVDYTANLKTLENPNGKLIEVWPNRPVDIQLDGDPFGKVHTAKFEVLPHAVKIRL